MVATYSSIFIEQLFLKQVGQRQSPPSDKLKIGGKSLHQHFFSGALSPQLKCVPQLEHCFTFIAFMR